MSKKEKKQKSYALYDAKKDKFLVWDKKKEIWVMSEFGYRGTTKKVTGVLESLKEHFLHSTAHKLPISYFMADDVSIDDLEVVKVKMIIDTVEK